jgi:NADH dehydrogenase
VRDTLQSVDYDEIFVAGDAAELGAPISKQGYHALDMGRCAARNAAALLGSRPLERYRPAEKPMLVSFGDLDCFLVAGPVVLASPALGAAKEAVFELVMAQLDGRDWSVSLPDAGARLRAAAQRIAWPALSSPASLLRHARWAVLFP